VIEREAALVGCHDQRVRVEPLSALHAQQKPVRPAVGDLEHGGGHELALGYDPAQLLERLIATNHPVPPIDPEPDAAHSQQPSRTARIIQVAAPVQVVRRGRRRRQRTRDTVAAVVVVAIAVGLGATGLVPTRI
jgi:hypothetical protein